LSEYHSAYIGLGSNLDDPLQQISHALRALKDLPQTRGLRCSHWYGSQAIGPGDQPDYINAAALIETQLRPLALLRQLQTIENSHGRQRDIRWGARTLDLDLLLYDNVSMHTKELQLPHPEIMQRNFVLYPLHDLSADMVLPNGQVLSTIIQDTSMSGLQLLNNSAQNNEDSHRE
jgi:2-amino-4-hydroxy-6-hydroxymethyldihydropteridine diphosphokinase